MQKLFKWIVAASCFLALTGCNSPLEKSAISSRYATQLNSLENAVDELESFDALQPAAQNLADACGRLAFLAESSTSVPCTKLSSLPALKLSIQQSESRLAAERLALSTYAEESDRRDFLQSFFDEVEAARRSLVATAALHHWKWDSLVGFRAQRFDAAVAGSVSGEVPKDYSLAALGKNQRESLLGRLDRERKLLDSFGQPGRDVLHEQTLDSVKEWRALVERSEPVVRNVPAFKTAIIKTANRSAWDLAVANAAPPPVRPELGLLEAELNAQSTSSKFASFLARVKSFEDLRAGAEIKSAKAAQQLLSTEAAERLVEDCRSLLILDEKSADEVCGAASSALELALDLTNPSSRSDASGPGSSGPAIGPTGPTPSDPQVIRLSEALKTRLLGGAAAARVTPLDRKGPSPEAINAHIEALKQRIGAISRAHAQASIQGFFVQLAAHEAQLEYIHETMRAAMGGSLPDRLRDPLALLSPSAAESALQDTRRLRRIVSRNLTLVPDAPELQVADQALGERATKLEKLLSAPPAQADLASVIRKIDPEKSKALLTEMSSKVAELTQRRAKTWADKFVGVAVNFDTWRGPRGPPAPDPKYPRSSRVLAAIKMLGANPTEAVQAFSALKAEHAEFYRETGAAGDGLAKSWEFGRKDPRAWMMGLLSPPDLAVANSILKEIARAPPTLKIADGWMELTDASERLQDAINLETKLRKEMAGRHPPGYPPGRPPAVVAIAEQYAEEWNRRRPQRLERQIRLQTASLMYPDPTTMPVALRSEVRGIVNSALQEEMTRLETLLSSLYGKNGQVGLLDRAARSVSKLTDSEMSDLMASKAAILRAADIITERIASAENNRFIEPDSGRRARIAGWYRGFGQGPPSAAPPPPPPPPPAPFGSGGANFLFTNSELERSFSEITTTLGNAEKSLKSAEVISTRSIKPTAVGAESGRAVANRQKWSNGTFSFEGMLDKAADKAATRYPKELSDWDGFFQKDGTAKRPFEFDRYVKNFTNFRGVGGGIHFGETATALSDTSKVLSDGGLLTYDDATQTIKLIVPSKATFSYGAVPPRVLKALYAYVTSYPGINLAVTIGATGDRSVARDRAGMPILLDPSFVDNPVGQDLYLADILPWALDRPTLPNGSANVASDDFARADQLRKTEELASIDKMVELVGTTKPLSSYDATALQGLLAGVPNASVLMATALSSNASEFKKVYQEVATSRAIEEYRAQYLAEIKKQAGDFRRAGYSSEDILGAISLLKKSDSLMSHFGDDPLARPDSIDHLMQSSKAMSLALQLRMTTISERGLSELKAIALYMGSGGQPSVGEPVRREIAQKKLKEAENIVAEDGLGLLATESNRAKRVFGVLALGFELDKSKKERRVSKQILQLAASALLEYARQQGKPIDARAVAQQIRGEVCDSRGLATLFDEKVSFSLADDTIRITPTLRYRYAVAEIAVTSSGLTCYFDGAEAGLTPKARQLGGLATVANTKLDDLAKAYPPLEKVRDYAGLVAFLRWAACPTDDKQSCRRRDGLTIDFSALGRYDLRDRRITPTPDMDARE